MPERIVLSDASPLIALVAIGQIDVLRQLYKQVLITDIVRKEVHAALPDWIEITSDYEAQQYQLLCLELDPGEASTIAFALKQPDGLLILDERKGRLIAKRLGLRVTGTVGIIVKAKEVGLITSGKDLLNQLEAQGFWLSKELKQQVLIRMGE